MDIENQYIFHLEGEEILIFGKLKRAKIQYKTELTSQIINNGFSSINIKVSKEDLVKFLCILKMENEERERKNEMPLYVYILLKNYKCSLINISESIKKILIYQQEENPGNKKIPRTIRVLNCQDMQEEQAIFIPFLDNWMIYYNPKLKYSKLFATGTYQKSLDFKIENKNPESDFEKRVVAIITEYLSNPKEEYQRTRIKEKNN